MLIKVIKESVDDLPITTIYFDKFVATLTGFIIVDNDIKKLYKSVKPFHKEVKIIIINANLVYGFKHINGILRIIDEEIKRNSNIKIKNLEIEFLTRICYTNQISSAIKINEEDKKNENFVIVLISESIRSITDTLSHIRKHVKQDDRLILPNKSKKSTIIDVFFKDKIKDNKIPIVYDDDLFVQFLVERAAISLI